jgi:hypothetical protein
MKSVKEFLGEQKLANLYQWMESMEKELKAKNIDPDQFLLQKLEENQRLLNEFDPVSLGVGALGLYGAQQGLKHIGGWQGLKNVAGAGWNAMKQGGRDMWAARNASMDQARRNDATSAAQAAGGQVTLPQHSSQNTQQDSQLVNQLKNDLTQLGASMHGAGYGNDPHLANMMKQFQALADAIQQRLTAIPQV